MPIKQREEEDTYWAVCRGTQLLETPLSQLLATRAGRFGVNQASVMRLLEQNSKKRRKPGNLVPLPDKSELTLQAAEIMSTINVRRGTVLVLIAEVGRTDWRSALEAYLRQTGPSAFDDLFLLGGEISDDLWADLMPSLMFPELRSGKGKPELDDNPEDEGKSESKDKLTRQEKDRLGCLRDAAAEAIGRVLIDSRAALARAIASTGETVRLPVCLYYCRAIAYNLLLREAMSGSENIPYDDAAARGNSKVLAAAASGALREGLGEVLGESEPVVGTVTRFVDAIYVVNQATPEEQRTIVEATWQELGPDKQNTMSLSKGFQDNEAEEFPDYIDPPDSDIRLAAKIGGSEAAQLQGIKLSAFHARVSRANAKFKICLIKRVNKLIQDRKLSAMQVQGKEV